MSCLPPSSSSSPEEDCHVVGDAAGFRRLHRFPPPSSSERSKVHLRCSATVPTGLSAPFTHRTISLHAFPQKGCVSEHHRPLVATSDSRNDSIFLVWPHIGYLAEISSDISSFQPRFRIFYPSETVTMRPQTWGAAPENNQQRKSNVIRLHLCKSNIKSCTWGI